MNDKGIFLVSLNSKKLFEFLNKESINIMHERQNLDVFVFDVHEVLNGLIFNSLNIEEQNNLIESTIDKVYDNLIKDVKQVERKFIRCSEIPKVIKPYLSKVYCEFYSNESFKRHCKSQIFQNLQPKLRTVGITNHKSGLIELLCPFLLTEIAFYLYLYHTGEYKEVFGLENEMEILEAIRNRKYENFVDYLKHDVLHIKVDY